MDLLILKPSKDEKQRRHPEDRPVQLRRPLRGDTVFDANILLSRIAGLADDTDISVAGNKRVDQIDAGACLVIVSEMQLRSSAHAFDFANRTQLNGTEPMPHFIS